MSSRIKRDLRKLSQQYLEEMLNFVEGLDDLSDLYHKYKEGSVEIEDEEVKNLFDEMIIKESAGKLFLIESEEERERRLIQYYRENRETLIKNKN